MPSGSGSGWSRMPSFSRGSISARSSTTRRRFSRCANSSSMSSRIRERRPARSRQRSEGSSSSSTRSESSSTGASGAASRTASRAARTKATSSLTIAKPSPVLKSSFAIASAERPPGSAWKPGGRKRDSFSRGTQLRTSSGLVPIWLHRRACSCPSHRMTRPDKTDPRARSAPRQARALEGETAWAAAV